MIAHHPRTKSLDGLRGVAILMVLSYHFLNFGILYPIFCYGWMGVDLFFVISGFLITRILASTREHKGYYFTFLIRRILRLWPLYYGVLIAFAFIAPHFNSTKWFTHYQWFYWTHTSNILIFLHGFFPPLGHFWSLAIEEQYYLFWPLMILLLKPRQVLITAFALVIAGILLRVYSPIDLISYKIPFAHADGLLMGSMVAIISRSSKKNLLIKHTHRMFWFATAVMIIFLLFESPRTKDLNANPFVFTIISCFFSTMLLMALNSKIAADLLSNKVLCFFGKYSYGMYIFFGIFFYFGTWAGAQKLSDNWKLLLYMLMFLLTIVSSYLSFNFFEVYFLRLKDKFTIPGTLEQ